MKKIKSILAGSLVVLVVVLYLFVFFKISVITGWSSPEVVTTYSIDGIDGRSLKVIFLPENKAITYYKDLNAGLEEYILSELYGTYLTHFFGGVWLLNDGDRLMQKSLLGFRIYSTDIKPVNMREEIIKKYINGNGDSSFSKIGKTTNAIYLFKENAIKVEGMWLQKVETDNQLVDTLLENLNK